MIECPRCYTKVPMDGDRPRPWCPHCGNEIKPGVVSCEPVMFVQNASAADGVEIKTVRQVVEEVVGPDPAKGPPVSRAYEHKSCHAVTIASGDDLVRLECPFRPLDGTYCPRCQDFVPLEDVRWSDSGETISTYRNRLKASVGFWRGLYLTVFCNAYQGAINLHLDKHGRPLQQSPATP
jgi:hypothetical protein